MVDVATPDTQSVDTTNLILRIFTAAALAATATDTLISRFPVVFPGQKGRDPTPGSSLAWEHEASTRGTLEKRGILAKLCLPLVLLGVTAISSSTLMVELGTRVAFGSRVVPELLSSVVSRGLRRGTIVSSAWFGGMALWISLSTVWDTMPKPSRGRVRLFAFGGWALVALMTCRTVVLQKVA